MSDATSGSAIARVYDKSDGEHVANLTNERLVHEFRESPLWEVEMIEQETEPTSVTQVGP